MTDPAVAYLPDDPGYLSFHRGKDLNVYLKADNGSDFIAIVWPGKDFRDLLFSGRVLICWRSGVTVYPGKWN